MFKYICRREGKKGIKEKVCVCFVILLLEKIEDWIIYGFFFFFWRFLVFLPLVQIDGFALIFPDNDGHD